MAIGESNGPPPTLFGIQAKRSSVWLRKTDLRLFALFAVYGPSFSFAGQLRYVEALVIVWSALHLRTILREASGYYSILAQLFLIAGAAHLVSGMINGSPSSAIITRTGTYVVLAALLLALNGMARSDQRRLAYMLGGYALSYVFILVVGTSTSRGYAVMPWRLGLGYAATVALALLFVARPRWQHFAPIAFIVLSGVHVFMGSRSLAAVTLVVAGIALIASVRRRQRPRSFNPGRAIGVVAFLLFGAWVGAHLLTYMAERNWLTEEMNQRILIQSNSAIGFWAAARPDTATAIHAIGASPIIGFGPSVVDPEIYTFYATIAAQSSVVAGEDYSALLQRRLDYEWVLGTPSHSHIFGAWADAGVLAAFCWALVLFIALRVLYSNVGFLHPWGPLYSLIAISTIWDIVFSPGPHRMDIALRIVVLLLALKHFRELAR